MARPSPFGDWLKTTDIPVFFTIVKIAWKTVDSLRDWNNTIEAFVKSSDRLATLSGFLNSARTMKEYRDALAVLTEFN